jgi:MFS family permease
MRSIGLTLADASLVNGLIPIFAFFLTPLLGYIGDKFGYKIVLISTVIGLMLSSTSLNFLPVYRVYSAKVGLDRNMYNDTLESLDQKSIIWFGKYTEYNSGCDFKPLENIITEINCESNDFNGDIKFKNEDIKSIESGDCIDLNVKTCKYIIQEEGEREIILCDAKFEDNNGYFEKGSHSLTLWTFFTLRTLVKVFSNVMYNISDGAASTITIKENASYATVVFFASIAPLLPNWVAGPIVDNFSFGTDYWDCLTASWVKVNDFKVPFFIQDAILLLMVILAFFFLEIEIKKPEKSLSFKEEFMWLLNPAPIGFFFCTFVTGLSVGAVDTYLFVFAQEDLGASISFLGYISNAATFSCILVLPFAKFVMDHLGIMNTFCLSMFLWCGRISAYGLTYSSPPYPFLAYGAMEFCMQLNFVAIIAYSSVIAPQYLIATAISIGSVMCWILGMGVGSLLAGFLVETFNIRVMFIAVGIASSSFFLLYWMLYHLLIKQFEVHQNKEKEEDESSANSATKYQKEEQFEGNLTSIMVSTRL